MNDNQAIRPAMPSPSSAPLPLDGLRVLDLSRVLAGPLAAQTLGDLGANVIKVERPDHGDDTRGWGPPFDEQGHAAYFLALNRNKRSIALDLDNDDHHPILHRLIASAHVVIENFRAGALERRGLGAQAALAANPELVWCTITGFGADSTRPGYDFVVQAESGWMAITGEPDGSPMKTGVALADVIAGKEAAISILAALASRPAGRSPSERHLSVSLAHAATAALVNVAQNVIVSGKDAGRWGNAHPNLAPYELFHAADRPLVIAVGTDAQWLACTRALDLATLGADPSLRTNAGRLAHRTRISETINARCRTAPAAHWIAALDAVDVPCGVVRSVQDALDAFGVAPPAPRRVRRPPPELDQHRTEILAHGWGPL